MTRKDCIRLLKQMKTIYFEDKKDKTGLLEKLKPTLLKLRTGNKVYEKIAEHVYANQYDAAVKQLKIGFRIDRFWPFSQIPLSKLKPSFLAASVLIPAGIGCLITGYYFSRLDAESASWPVTTGTVIHSGVTEKINEEHDHITYHPNIIYSYSIYGKQYKSDRRGIAVKKIYEKKYLADSIANSYPRGSSVTVYYNPKNHSYAVLESGSGNLHFLVYIGYMIFFMALFFLLLPFVFFLGDRYLERKRERKKA